MSGIWERAKGAAEDRLPAHLWEAMFRAYAGGFATPAQIVTVIDAQLQSPLTTAEKDDLAQITDLFDALSNSTADRLTRLELLEKLGYAGIAAEMGAINETKFRSDLGIT